GKGAVRTTLSGFIACVVSLGPLVHSSVAAPERDIQRSFVMDCGPGKAGPDLRLTREVRPGDGRTDVTLTVTNTGRIPAKAARFPEPSSQATDDPAWDGAGPTDGRLSYRKPLLRWTGDLAPGRDATIHYAFTARPGPASIRTVGTDAGTTCQSA